MANVCHPNNIMTSETFVLQTIFVKRESRDKKKTKRRRKELQWHWTEAHGSIPPSLARWPGYALGWLSANGLAFYERSLERFGVKAPHVSVLVVLDAEGSMVQARLSDRLRIDRATMVSVLDDLEEKGFTSRSPHPTDGRAYLVDVTSEGRRTLREIEQVSDEGTKHFFGALTEAERQTFDAMLLKLVAERS